MGKQCNSQELCLRIELYVLLIYLGEYALWRLDAHD